MTLQVRLNDTFLVSYPKSGNTWLRFLIANLLRADPPVGLVEADQMIPSVDGTAKSYFDSMKSPRIIKSHFSFLPSYKRVIYVVRDPRDVVMSQYHYQIKRGVLAAGTPLDGYVQRFLDGAVSPYGSWGEHAGSWLAVRRQDPHFLLLRYEDMLANPASAATCASNFLGLPADADRVALAVERSSLDAMRKVEKAEGQKWDSTKGTRQDMSFFRSAKSGEGCAVLSRESIDRIENAWGPLMRSLNYSVSERESRSKVASADMQSEHQPRL